MPGSRSPSIEDFRKPKKVAFRFCSECSNLLYPREDEENSRLMYACRTCQYSEEAQSNCIYHRELGSNVGETAGITQDVGSDPTVGDPTSDSSSILSVASDTMSSCLSGFCTACGQEILCALCGEPTEFGPYLEVDDADSTRAGKPLKLLRRGSGVM